MRYRDTDPSWKQHYEPDEEPTQEKQMPLRKLLTSVIDHLPTRSLAIITLLSVVAFVTWANSDDGYARAGTVKELRVGSLEERLFTNRVLQCGAIGPLRQAYAEKLQAMLREYRDLTGTTFPLPTCAELGL
jgi:hypothetical protein